MKSNFAKIAIALRDDALIPVNVVSADARLIVAQLAQEPKPGFKANELTYSINSEIEIALTSRDRGHGVAVVRVNGEVVYRESDAQGNATLIPGVWQAVIHAKAKALREIELQHELQQGGILALPKAA